MAKVKVYNGQGQITKELELDKAIYEIEVNPGLVHQVVVAQMANSRPVVAHTKDRGEVRGGGKKPWKQKGTGRARHGSIRSPLWRGGGVTFGPGSERNFTKKINKKMRRKALFMSLSDKVGEHKFLVLDQLLLPEAKTKQLQEILNNLPLDKKTLLVLPKQDLNIVKAAANLKKLQVILADSLNVYDILNNQTMVVIEDSLNVIKSVYLK